MSSTRHDNNIILGLSTERRPATSTAYKIGDVFFEQDTGIIYVVAWDTAQDKLEWREISGQVPDVSDTDFIIYLNATTGNDSASGKTPQTAIRTIEELRRRRPDAWRGKCRARFAPGTYPMPEDSKPYFAGKPLNPAGEPEVWEGAYTTLAVTATGGTTDTVTYNGSQPNGSLRGAFVHVTSGDNTDFWTSVVDNVGNTITLFTEAPNAFVNGDTLDILRSSVIIDATAADFGIVGSPFGHANVVLFYLTGIKILKGPGIIVGAIGASIGWDRVEIDHQGSGLQLWGYGSITNSAINIDGVISTEGQDIPVYIHGTSGGFGGSVVANEGGDLMCSFIADDTFFYLEGASSHNFIEGDYRRSPWSLKRSAIVGFAGAVFYDFNAATQYRSVLGLLSSTAVLEVSDGSSITTNGEADFSNNTADAAIRIATNSFVPLEDVTGAGNSGVGIQLINSGRAMITPGTTVTGAGGDIDLDGTPVTYAAVAGAVGEAVSDVRLNVVFLQH